MVSAKTIKSNAISTPKSPTTTRIALDTLRSANNAIVPKLRNSAGDTVALDDIAEAQGATLIAKGGYNSVWLVRLHGIFEVTQAVVEESDSPPGRVSSFSQYILRLPCEDSLLPYQVTNEVACRNLVTAKLPHVPVPRVFFYQATSRYDESFIAEEYINGIPLSSHWMDLTSVQKQSVAERLAAITVDIAEARFDKIGGLDPTTLEPGPTVEGSKLFKGRGEFHSQDYYHIGPYVSTKEYVLVCYDRDICYYSQAPQHGIDIDSDLFTDVSVQDFVVELQKKKDSLAAADIADEPFALVHGDFHGRNILSDGDQVLAILDWEFAGSYPLSETLSGGGIDVVEAVSEELDDENTGWN